MGNISHASRVRHTAQSRGLLCRKTDEDSIWIRDGLYALISDVLFVPDREDPHKFHPRIGVQHDYIYRALNDWEKAAFNRLYDQYYYHATTSSGANKP